MNASKKTIQFTGVASIVLIVATYLITVNIENQLLSINSPWISNNFLLTIIGGAFASMLVVLACEIQKFCTMKASTEAFLFFHATQLYVYLFQMQKNAHDYQNHTEKEINETLFDGPLSQAQNELYSILSADYATFSPRNSIMKEHQIVREKLQKNWQPLFSGNNALKIVILEEKISRVELGKDRTITSGVNKVRAVLATHERRSMNAMEIINAYLKAFEKEDKEKYPWFEIKDSMEQAYVSIFDAWSLERYINGEKEP